MSFLSLLAGIAGKKFSEEVPPAIEAIKKDPVKGVLETMYDVAAPVGLQAALYSPEAEAMFGGAGRQDLVLSRGMGLTSLLNRLINSKQYDKLGARDRAYIEGTMRANNRQLRQLTDKDVPILQSPSLAIHRDTVDNQFDDGVFLVMRPDKFDPANTGRSKLYNRDVYTKRSDTKDGFFIPQWHGKPAALDPRMTERLSYNAANIDEWIQGLASPKFKTFAEFEGSKAGAGALDSYKSAGFSGKEASRAAFKSALQLDMKRNANKEGVFDRDLAQLDWSGSDSFLQNLKNYVDKADSGALGKTSKQVMELAKKMPSAYAELKYAGPAPIDAEHVLGIMLRSEEPALRRAVAAGYPGIPVVGRTAMTGNKYMLDMLAEQIKRR